MTKRSTASAQMKSAQPVYQEEEVATTTAAANPSPEITLQDLQLMKQIIDICSTRGAFKPAEMATVGSVYNKLDSFLQAVADQQKAAEGDK
jgi:hypothetical protein